MAQANVQFGAQLRRWRSTRGCSQLELSARAGYSQRHLSFLESGRSRPSRHTVLTLAEALDVPLGERNQLLHAAGFAPAFGAEPLASEALAPAARALQAILAGHRPFPALIVDAQWNMYGANDNAALLFARFTADAGAQADGPANALRQCIDPAGLRPFICNWPAFAGLFARGLRRELAFDPNAAGVRELLTLIEADPEYDPAAVVVADGPVAQLQLERDGQVCNLFTMVSAFSAPQDVTLAALRVETFFPADEQTRALLEQIDAALPR